MLNISHLFRRMLVVASAASIGALSLVGAASSASATVSTSTNWVQVGAPLSGPSARFDSSMVYDAATGTTVLFGGYNGGYLAETWTWNGTAWTKLSPATSPPALRGAAMVYDPFTHNVVLFGGLGSTGPVADTWTWDGTTWTKQLATGPAARSGASMAYDATTHNVVLFGGLGTSGPLADTWVWSGTSWTAPTLTTTPPTARYQASMAYDTATQSVVLFGGDGASAALGDTWTWDGTNWTKSLAASPPARYGSSMIYDESSDDVVLFGGTDGTNANAETWIWNGTYWTTQVSSTPPSARYDAAMSYNTTSNSATLFGGFDGVTTSSDTWAYNVVPGSPRTVKATSNANGQSVVTWSAPASNGGSPVLGYSVLATDTTTSSHGGQTCSTTTATTCTLTGLTNGDHYVFAVSAISGVGTGLAASSNVAIPATAPSAPTITSVTPGVNQLTVSWTAPTSTGGTPIASYRVTARSGGAFCHVPGRLTSCRIAGLTAGAVYSFTMTATNAAGTSVASGISARVKPRALPSAPTIIATSVSGDLITIRWKAPTSNGGVRLSHYDVYVGSRSGGEYSQPYVTLSYHDFGFTFSGLPGHAYYFFVRAANVIGIGAHSNQVVAVTKK
jgi:hypothetical protein